MRFNKTIVLATCFLAVCLTKIRVVDAQAEVLAYDVDGDGSSTPGDQFVVSWWLLQGGCENTLRDAVAFAGATEGCVDLSSFFSCEASQLPRGVSSRTLPMFSTTACQDAPCVFVRGDSNCSGVVDIADAVFSLEALFRGGVSPESPDSGDANDDGTFQVADVIDTFDHLLGRGQAPPHPYPSPGKDLSVDSLSPECHSAAALNMRDVSAVWDPIALEYVVSGSVGSAENATSLQAGVFPDRTIGIPVAFDSSWEVRIPSFEDSVLVLEVSGPGGSSQHYIPSSEDRVNARLGIPASGYPNLAVESWLEDRRVLPRSIMPSFPETNPVTYMLSKDWTEVHLGDPGYLSTISPGGDFIVDMTSDGNALCLFVCTLDPSGSVITEAVVYSDLDLNGQITQNEIRWSVSLGAALPVASSLRYGVLAYFDVLSESYMVVKDTTADGIPDTAVSTPFATYPISSGTGGIEAQLVLEQRLRIAAPNEIHVVRSPRLPVIHLKDMDLDGLAETIVEVPPGAPALLVWPEPRAGFSSLWVNHCTSGHTIEVLDSDDVVLSSQVVGPESDVEMILSRPLLLGEGVRVRDVTSGFESLPMETVVDDGDEWIGKLSCSEVSLTSSTLMTAYGANFSGFTRVFIYQRGELFECSVATLSPDQMSFLTPPTFAGEEGSAFIFVSSELFPDPAEDPSSGAARLVTLVE